MPKKPKHPRLKFSNTYPGFHGPTHVRPAELAAGAGMPVRTRPGLLPLDDLLGSGVVLATAYVAEDAGDLDGRALVEASRVADHHAGEGMTFGGVLAELAGLPEVRRGIIGADPALAGEAAMHAADVIEQRWADGSVAGPRANVDAHL